MSIEHYESDKKSPFSSRLTAPLENGYKLVVDEARTRYPDEPLANALARSPDLASKFLALTFVMPPMVVIGLTIDHAERSLKKLINKTGLG